MSPKTAAAAKFRDVEDDPRIIAANEKLNDITSRLREAQAELASASNAMSSTRHRAEAVLNGLDPNAEEAQAVRTRAAIAKDIETYTLAQKLQGERVAAMRQTVQREYRQALLPEHGRLAMGIADALRGLTDALEAELRFRDQLDQHRIEHGSPMQPATFSLFGRTGMPAIEYARQQADEIEAAHAASVNG